MSTAPRREQRTVPPEADGRRLDLFLAEALDLSRSRLQTLIREGRVRVDGQVEKPGFRVSTGARVELEIPPPAVSHLVAQPLDLDILFEDADLLIVNKPPGLVVHPGAGNPDRTLVNALVHHCPDIEGVGGVRRPPPGQGHLGGDAGGQDRAGLRRPHRGHEAARDRSALSGRGVGGAGAGRTDRGPHRTRPPPPETDGRGGAGGARIRHPVHGSGPV